jgi:UPF0716 protein FxsA
MSLLGRLALLFVGVPLLELFILIQLGQWLGLWPTIGMVVLTGMAGAALARLEGLRTLWRIRRELALARLPGQALLDGLAVLLGGALLLTPGVLTDIAGLSFILPPTRRLLLGRIQKSLEKRLKSGAIRITHVEGFSTGAGFAWGSDSSSWPESAEWEPTTLDRSGEIVVETESSGEPEER